MHRRTLLALGTSATVGAVAGCTSLTGEDTHERTFETTTADLEDPEPSDAIGEDGFSTYVNSMREEFGETGIWGTSGERPTDAFAHVGALTETLHHENDVISNHALAVYTLTAADGDESPVRRYQCWLWSGYDVTDSPDDLTGISIALDARSSAVAIGVYAPWDAVAADDATHYELSLAQGIGEHGLSASVPLRDGSVVVDEEATTVGPEGSVRTRWSGTEAERYALWLTCEGRWDARGSNALEWTVTGTFS